MGGAALSIYPVRAETSWSGPRKAAAFSAATEVAAPHLGECARATLGLMVCLPRLKSPLQGGRAFGAAFRVYSHKSCRRILPGNNDGLTSNGGGRRRIGP